MADREKVIKGLECCNMPNNHNDCPYNGAAHYNICTHQLLTDAIALLKEQEPRVLTLEEVMSQLWDYCYIEAEVRPRSKMLETLCGTNRLYCTTSRMTNERAINVLRGQVMAYGDTLSEAEHKAYDKAVEALERTRWRNAKTEPPEVDTNVIAYARGKNDPIYRIIIASMSDRNIFDVHIKTDPYWREPWQFFDTMYEITHWMPRPEEPGEEE